MKNILSSVIFTLAICLFFIVSIFLVSSCVRNTVGFSVISNFTITTVDVMDSGVLLNGRLHSSVIVVYDYESRIEDNDVFVKIHLDYPNKNKQGTGRTYIKFEQPLPGNIEKIFIEDDKNNIMVWEKSQGYGEFDIEDMWKDELQKLKEQN